METKICCQKKDTWFYPGTVAGVRSSELSMFSLCLTSFQHPTKIEISAPPTKSSILSFLGIICYWNCSCNNKRVMMTTQRCHTNKSITLYVHHTYSIVPHLHIFTTYDGICPVAGRGRWWPGGRCSHGYWIQGPQPQLLNKKQSLRFWSHSKWF